jgi:hypothetical protein
MFRFARINILAIVFPSLVKSATQREIMRIRFIRLREPQLRHWQFGTFCLEAVENVLLHLLVLEDVLVHFSKDLLGLSQISLFRLRFHSELRRVHRRVIAVGEEIFTCKVQLLGRLNRQISRGRRPVVHTAALVTGLRSFGRHLLSRLELVDVSRLAFHDESLAETLTTLLLLLQLQLQLAYVLVCIFVVLLMLLILQLQLLIPSDCRC